MSDTLGQTLDFDGFECDGDWARGGFTVSDKHRQPYGIVHGGVLSSLAESVASWATWQGVKDDGNLASGQTNQTSFLRPINSGRVTAEAKARHMGRTTWVWDVEISDEEGRLCALNRMTVAVRPMPEDLVKRLEAEQTSGRTD